jgi:hypothetical protein
VKQISSLLSYVRLGGFVNKGIFLSLCFLVVLGVTYQYLSTSYLQRSNPNRQEEVAEELIDISYQAKNEDEAEIIDLIWLQKASAVVRKRGARYFNVIEQDYRETTPDDQTMAMPILEGIIEISYDQESEYDAIEIEKINVFDLK